MFGKADDDIYFDFDNNYQDLDDKISLIGNLNFTVIANDTKDLVRQQMASSDPILSQINFIHKNVLLYDELINEIEIISNRGGNLK